MSEKTPAPLGPSIVPDWRLVADALRALDAQQRRAPDWRLAADVLRILAALAEAAVDVCPAPRPRGIVASILADAEAARLRGAKPRRGRPAKHKRDRKIGGAYRIARALQREGSIGPPGVRAVEEWLAAVEGGISVARVRDIASARRADRLSEAAMENLRLLVLAIVRDREKG